MRIASALLLAVSGWLAVTIGAQTPAPQAPGPRTYTLLAEVSMGGRKISVAIYRDGQRERVEMAPPGLSGKMATIYDFEAHRVYWMMTGPNPGCSSGRYPSSRAPVGEDPVTGSTQTLAELSKGGPRKFVRREEVNGIPARLEELAPPVKPPAPEEIRFSRVWISEPDGIIVKMEGAPRGGTPATVLEVKRFTTEKPEAALFVPQAGCQVTDSEADDTGSVRAHVEAEISAKASGEVNLANRSGQSSAAASSAPRGTPAPPATNGGITAVTVQVRELQAPGPCGRKLQVRGTISVDGPATVWYRFYTTASGLDFYGGALGTIRIKAAGSADLVKDVALPASKDGEIRFEAAVQEPSGRRGAVTIANAATFNVVCGAAPPRK
jgi:hypothetical protein